MWTKEKKNINGAASTYISNLVYDKSLIEMEIPEGIRYFIREASIAGAKYVIGNTQKKEIKEILLRNESKEIYFSNLARESVSYGESYVLGVYILYGYGRSRRGW